MRDAAARRPPRPRRTQEERSAATREKVLRAATACLAELGFRGATLSVIAERAGVTWGAMQHQFGDKEAILDAVQQASLDALVERLGGLAETVPDPAERVHAFVEGCGELLRGPDYGAFMEIQLARGRDPETPARSERMGRVLGRLFTRVFGDLGLPPRQLSDARRFTFVVLSGIAAESALFAAREGSRRQLAVLEDTLLRLLELEEER